MQFNTFESREDTAERVEALYFSGFSPLVRRHGKALYLTVGCVFIVAAVALLALGRRGLFDMVLYFLSLLGALICFWRYILVRLHTFKALQAFDKSGHNHVVTLDENGLTTGTVDDGCRLYYSWQYVDGLVESEHLYLFTTVTGICIYFNKQWLAGLEDEFEANIKAHILPQHIKPWPGKK